MAASGGDTEKCWEPMASCPQSSEALRQREKKKKQQQQQQPKQLDLQVASQQRPADAVNSIKSGFGFLKTGGRPRPVFVVSLAQCPVASLPCRVSVSLCQSLSVPPGALLQCRQRMIPKPQDSRTNCRQLFRLSRYNLLRY